MKSLHYPITLALGALCLVLSITTIVLGRSNSTLQSKQQQQQTEINRGQMSVQVGQNILRDMAEISLKNEKIKQVLSRNGYTVNVAPSPTPTATPAK